MKEKEIRLSEIQPNSQQREELLLVIQYLLENEISQDKAIKSSDIVKYAKDKFNIIFRRDRVTHNLIHLYQLQQEGKYNFPFTLECKELDSGFKFFIKSRRYSEKELLDIGGAIRKDSSKSPDNIDKLIDKIYSNNLPKSAIEKIKNKLNKRNEKINSFNFSLTGEEIYEKFRDLENNKTYCNFSFKTKRKIKNIDKFKKFTPEEEATLTFEGYVHRIIEVEGVHKLVIYLPETKNAFIIAMGELDSEKKYKKKPAPEFLLEKNDGKCLSIDDWIAMHYKGQDGIVYNFVVRYKYDDSKTYRYIKTMFKQHYNNIDKQVYIKEVNVAEENEEEFLVKYEYVSFKSNMPSFNKWLSKYDLLNHVEVISPNFYNNEYLLPLVQKLIKNITTHGEKYDINVQIKFKDEYFYQCEEYSKSLEEKAK